MPPGRRNIDYRSNGKWYDQTGKAFATSTQEDDPLKLIKKPSSPRKTYPGPEQKYNKATPKRVGSQSDPNRAISANRGKKMQEDDYPAFSGATFPLSSVNPLKSTGSPTKRSTSMMKAAKVYRANKRTGAQ